MSLLYAKRPIVINPDLAAAIGLNEAIALQQLHYWLTETDSGVEHDGRRWVYNTLDQWQKQFPFWSVDTVKRTFSSLQKSGVILVEKLAAKDHNQTNFYAIDYHHPALMEQGKMPSSNSGKTPPIEQGKLPSSKSAECPGVLTEITTEITTENTTEITDKDNVASAPVVFAESKQSDDVRAVFEHWQTVMAKPRAKLDDARRRLIQRALKGGYTVDDLKKAVDGCRASPFHMGENTQRTKYNGLDLIMRNSEKIDGFMERVGASRPRSAHTGFQPEDYQGMEYVSPGAEEWLNGGDHG